MAYLPSRGEYAVHSVAFDGTVHTGEYFDNESGATNAFIRRAV